MPNDDAIDVESAPTPGTELAPLEKRPLATVVSPTTPMGEWNVIVAQAEMLSQAEIVPSAYRRKPANVIAAALTGRTFGWDVMAAMRNGNVIEGTYAIKPEAQLGLVRAAGHSVSGSTEDLRATVTGRRADNGDTMTVTWTIDRAVRAGLCTMRDNAPYSRSRNGSKLPWEQYPEAMLWARAVSELCRQLFSDVTLGLSYTVEEIAGGAFTEDAAGEVHQEAAALPPPEGWADWGECDAAHDAYIDLWKSAEPDVRRKMTQYAKDAGYGRPMTRAQLDEIEAQLEIEMGASVERVKPEDSSAPGTPTPGADDATPATGDEERPARSSEPVAGPDPGADEGGTVEASGESAGPAQDGVPGGPDPASDPAPPAEEPMADKGECARLAMELKRVWPKDPLSALARGAVVDVVSNGRTRSARELTQGEIRMAIKVAKGLTAGTLGFGVYDPPEAEHATLLADPGEVPDDQQVPTVLAVIPEGGTIEAGETLLAELGAFLGVEVQAGDVESVTPA